MSLTASLHLPEWHQCHPLPDTLIPSLLRLPSPLPPRNIASHCSVPARLVFVQTQRETAVGVVLVWAVPLVAVPGARLRAMAWHRPGPAKRCLLISTSNG